MVPGHVVLLARLGGDELCGKGEIKQLELSAEPKASAHNSLEQS
jgi:hypothetical protein